MALWKRRLDLDAINRGEGLPCADNMDRWVGLKVTEIGDDYLRATLPVDHRTKQPFGLLHGGASCVLAESLGSLAANLCLEPGPVVAVGLNIEASHVRSATQGIVTATARPLHIGRSTQLWDIKIEDEAQRLVCAVRLTTGVKRLHP
ncbi:MAG TPA: hotdog fold thioesterase [Nevskiaceae bacterium]|nr:hotdog fold thioesterase [Nevskiaceae bacterium]